MVSNTDEMNLKCALGKAQSRCRLIRVACMIFAGVYALIWIAATVLALMGDNGLGSTSAVFYSVLHGALFLAMLLLLLLFAVLSFQLTGLPHDLLCIL